MNMVCAYDATDIKTIQSYLPSLVKMHEKDAFKFTNDTMAKSIIVSALQKKYPLSTFKLVVSKNHRSGTLDINIVLCAIFMNSKEYNKFKLIEGIIN